MQKTKSKRTKAIKNKTSLTIWQITNILWSTHIFVFEFYIFIISKKQADEEPIIIKFIAKKIMRFFELIFIFSRGACLGQQYEFSLVDVPR